MKYNTFKYSFVGIRNEKIITFRLMDEAGNCHATAISSNGIILHYYYDISVENIINDFFIEWEYEARQ